MDRCFHLILSLLFVCLSDVYAQGTVEGTVHDADTREALIGAQIVVEGTTLGTISDENGGYQLSGIPTGEQRLVFRYVGYRSEIVRVRVGTSETAFVVIALHVSPLYLDEVVVTGAGGPVEKRRLGNSIATVRMETLETAPVGNLSEILQGREPGVVAMPSGGLTGEGTRLRIRGSASLSQSNEPVVYVDGIRMNHGGGFGRTFLLAETGGSPSRLDDIDPESIERIEILKGAAAATLYGSEASNGVIQIFTKRGAPGPPRFDFRLEQSASVFSRSHPHQTGFARTPAQADTMRTYFGGEIRPYQLVARDFVSDLYETGRGQTYSASVSGGTYEARYFANLRWQNEDGPFGGQIGPSARPGTEVLARDVLRRVQGMASISVVPSERLVFRVATSFNNFSLVTPWNNNNGPALPTLSIFSKPERVAFNNRTGSTSWSTINEALQQTLEQKSRRFTARTQLDYFPLTMLALNGAVGVDFTQTSSLGRRPFGWNVDGFAIDFTDGAQFLTESSDLEATFDLKGTLTNDFGDQWSSSFLVGTQGHLSRYDELGDIALNFPGPGIDVVGAAGQNIISEVFSEVAAVGVYVQEQVGFGDYLFATAGARLDASSAFGSEFDGAFYPKLALSFIPSDAPFWRRMGPLSSFRLRAAVGRSGLQPGAFDAQTTYAAAPSTRGPGIVPGNLGNPHLKPEVSTEWEIGAEAGLFLDRLAIEATYWNRTVRDALVARQFAVSGGFMSRQLDNIGEIQAQGFELGMEAHVVRRPRISVDLFANAAYLWERVTDLGDAPPLKVGGSYPRYRNFLIEEYAPGANFGARLRDVPEGFLPVDFNNDGEPDRRDDVRAYLAGLTPQTAALPLSPFEVLMADSDGDGDALDHYLGKPTPDWQGAFGGSVTLVGAVTLSTLFEYRFGNYYVNDLTNAFRQANPNSGLNLPSSARIERDYITGGVDDTFNPQNNPDVRMTALEAWLGELLALAPFSGLNSIRPADYLRLREVSLTYRVPDAFVRPLRARHLTITVAGRNLALWTRYPGVDPEVNAVGRGTGSQFSQNFLDGVEAFGFPLPRRIQFTLRFGF